MSAPDRLFTEDFSADPWWWTGFRPPATVLDPLPRQAGTLVVGAGYAGVACALRLAEAGEDVVVLDAGAIGQGASTRSGGQVFRRGQCRQESEPRPDRGPSQGRAAARRRRRLHAVRDIVGTSPNPLRLPSAWPDQRAVVAPACGRLAGPPGRGSMCMRGPRQA